MAISKITSADLVNVGVIGLADTPELSTTAMQNKFEETARSVIIPKVNEIIEKVPLKTEVTAEINEKITEIGAGDMAKAVYDTNNDGIVDTAEFAQKDTDGNVIGTTYFKKSKMSFDTATATLTITLD